MLRALFERLDLTEKRDRVQTLATAVAERADREEALYRTIGIKVVTPPFEVNTRARSLPGPAADAELIREVAVDLLAEFRDAAVRKLGVRVSNLSFEAGTQASLDGFNTEERETEWPDDGPGRTDETNDTETETDETEASYTLNEAQTRFEDFTQSDH